MIGNRCATQETSTALVLACVEAGDLSAARRVHAEARAAGLALQLRAHNALINALGRATRLGDAVRPRPLLWLARTSPEPGVPAVHNALVAVPGRRRAAFRGWPQQRIRHRVGGLVKWAPVGRWWR